MNILIVGNGFDLSHFLPTKYDHFMIAMDAIENWDTAKGEMGFDDLFINDYWYKNDKTGEEEQNKFFQHTKAMYKTEEIKIFVDEVEKLQNQLEENVWYQYFSEHVREVRTWIDFELKIKEALEIVCEYMVNLERFLKNKNSLDGVISSFKNNRDGEYFLSQKYIRILQLLSLLDVKYQKYSGGGSPYLDEIVEVEYIEDWQFSTETINEVFVQTMKGFDIYNYKEVTSFLRKLLVDFSKLFNDYLKLFDNISFRQKLKNPIANIERVYSFNYTSTYPKNYDETVESYFLHGKLSTENKLVLGVSDLDSDLLHKFNLWGFTKYHQKLFFDTDYQFIDEYIPKKLEIIQNVELTKAHRLSECATSSRSVAWIKSGIQRAIEDNSLDLNFYIWGHSLDESDRGYIEELFSFNEPYDQQVRIVVYHFNDEAKYDLLANLINILTKEKVEKWMKKDWLKFEPNPDIAKLNIIAPAALPKVQR
ncbi:hypothetical protein GIX10_01575 [Acinetobacter sp. YIM 103518]|uniref:Bacteriophage abortive infection AbiH n=1 Tax=Acinetobacter faecalis TaxID=2665161 RepID=A0A6L6GCN9_9GAMM|nr:AbiH family protein [Acinetobacter faecalis]MTD10147.1 hypothetical protein [Acinetobacter faecalis]